MVEPMSDEMPKMTRFERREFDAQVTYADGSQFEITYDDLRCMSLAPSVPPCEMTMRKVRIFDAVEAHPNEKPKVRNCGQLALGFEWTHWLLQRHLSL